VCPAYRTTLVKSDGIVDTYVGGQRTCSYTDCGVLAPMLDSGRMGFRHVQTYIGQHRNVRVERIVWCQIVDRTLIGEC